MLIDCFLFLKVWFSNRRAKIRRLDKPIERPIKRKLSNSVTSPPPLNVVEKQRQQQQQPTFITIPTQHSQIFHPTILPFIQGGQQIAIVQPPPHSLHQTQHILNIEQLQPKYAKSLSVPSPPTTTATSSPTPGNGGSPKEPTVMVVGEPHQQYHKYYQHLQQLGYTAIQPSTVASSISPTPSPNQQQQPMLIAVTPNEVSTASSSVTSPTSITPSPMVVPTLPPEMMRKLSNIESMSKSTSVAGMNIDESQQPSSSSQMVYYVVHHTPQTANPTVPITTPPRQGLKSQLGSDVKNINANDNVTYTSYRDVVAEDSTKSICSDNI